jgi:alanine racemase
MSKVSGKGRNHPFWQAEDLVTADELAEIKGTINYEIVCAVGSRVPRIYIS